MDVYVNGVKVTVGGGGVSKEYISNMISGKQDKLVGSAGQVVGFNEAGEAVAQAAPEGGVTEFNGRKGAILPQAGDYTAADVGAVPDTRTVNGKPLSGDINLTASDVGARPSTWMPTAAEVGAAESGHSHTAADVGAKASGWKPFHVGTSAPSDTTQLWVDTTANTGGLKYHNGSAWVHVPVAYT